jgi:hypothetical protein
MDNQSGKRMGSIETKDGGSTVEPEPCPRCGPRHVCGPMLPAVQMVICSIASSVRSNARVRPGRRTIRA